MTKSKSITCYVALGSNLGNSVAYIKEGIESLKNHSEIACLVQSPLYQSKPHGPQDQPDYINAAVKFETTLKPEKLLDELQEIENKNGRTREGVERWGARTLDLDLLFYGDETIDTKRLTVPHPRICERAFVLYPLRDLIEKQGKENLKISSNNTTLNECIVALSKKEKSDIKEYLSNE